MRVKLLSRMEFIGVPQELGLPRGDQLCGTNAEQLVEVAGRTCYDSFGRGRSSEGFHAHILEVGHESVLEHAQFTFFITGVSRGLTHELVRHRIGVAISQRSTRYVDEDESPWVEHPLLVSYLHRYPESRLGQRWDAAVNLCRSVYKEMVAELEKDCLDRGVDRPTARKQARGAARGILGNALETELVWSANIRALRHIIRLRASNAADAEIRQLGVALLNIMKTEVPQYFRNFTAQASDDGLGEVAVEGGDP